MAPSSEFARNLETIDAAANVVVDMFLDVNSTIANSTTLPQYEVMVWMAAYGDKKPSKYTLHSAF